MLGYKMSINIYGKHNNHDKNVYGHNAMILKNKVPWAYGDYKTYLWINLALWIKVKLKLLR